MFQCVKRKAPSVCSLVVLLSRQWKCAPVQDVICGNGEPRKGALERKFGRWGTNRKDPTLFGPLHMSCLVALSTSVIAARRSGCIHRLATLLNLLRLVHTSQVAWLKVAWILAAWIEVYVHIYASSLDANKNKMASTGIMRALVSM
jgi:hypothetical protein